MSAPPWWSASTVVHTAPSAKITIMVRGARRTFMLRPIE
jgi:hypothetical protein